MKDREHVYSLFAGGVVTYASQGTITGISDTTRKGRDAEVIAKFRPAGKGMEVSFYGYWSPSHDMKVEELRRGEQTKRCTFAQWIDSNLVAGAIKGEEGLAPFTLNRDQLIRRVANEYDGSHPAGEEVPAHALEASRATRYLLGHTVLGLPLPYFLILKAAKDILDCGRKYPWPAWGLPTNREPACAVRHPTSWCIYTPHLSTNHALTSADRQNLFTERVHGSLRIARLGKNQTLKVRPPRIRMLAGDRFAKRIDRSLHPLRRLPPQIHQHPRQQINPRHDARQIDVIVGSVCATSDGA